MLKYTFLLLGLLFTAITFAQNDGPVPTVEKSINSLQFNLGGLFYVHEKGLNESLVLHLEAGLHGTGYYSIADDDATNNFFALRPIVIVEPRVYYNLAKRARKDKVTSNNSGNFFGIALDYQPDVQLFTTNPAVTPQSVVSFTPRWGIRRQLGQRFDFEFSIGLRSVYYKERGESRIRRAQHRTPSIGWRFGYRF